MTLFPTIHPLLHLATKYRKIPGASRQHTYREPGQPEAALGPASCPSSELDWDSEQMWQAEKSLKDHQADPREGGCWGMPGEEPRLSAPTLSWGPPCGRLGAAISPTGEERPEHWELRTASRWIKCKLRGGEPWTKLACCLVEWASWMGLSSLQFSISVFMLLPRSCPVTSLYSFFELPFLLPL